MMSSTFEYNKARRTIVVKWPYDLKPYTQHEVSVYCVADPEWQKFRLTLKSVPTTKKLEMLELRRKAKLQVNIDGTSRGLARKYQVQIDNYINALKRGGQLNMKLEVVK